MTRIVLVNAVYFKGVWNQKFDPRFTNQADFYVTPDKTVKVPMMFQRGTFRVSEYSKFQKFKCSMIELPYEGKKVVMQLILPNKNVDISEIEGKLDNLASSFAESSSEMSAMVRLPKFKIAQEIDLKEPLTGLNQNMNDLFEGNPDFSNMVKKAQLSISKAVQKVFIEVNEEGSEAAAATAVVIRQRSGFRGFRFNANRPFIFLIRDTITGLVLFQGRIVDPTVEE